MIKKKDTFLLIKRAKKNQAEDYWCPITGAVEKDETQVHAVIREAREEMGLTVEPVKKVWECPTENHVYIIHWWFVRVTNEAIRENPAEVKEHRWVDSAAMDSLEKMFDADRYFFKEIAIHLEDSFG